MATWIDFKQLRQSLDFEAVLRHYSVEIKRKGKQHLSFCPLPNHQGKRNSPSFSANLEKGIFQCFGCGAKGNLLEFAALMENVDPTNGTELHKVAVKLQERFCVTAAVAEHPPPKPKEAEATKELFACGMRNQYDIKVNNVGELFTWDADMEWDMGDPWYRPTRLTHVISGADFGFRNGTGKWPDHYLDSFGSLVDIGKGSPTGNTFGYGAKFPKKYQDAHFFLDHQYGRIYAAHLTPSGSTYTAEVELFLSAQPFNAADITINPVDGAMYMVLGGRSSQSSLWRISYTGTESTAPTTPDLRLQAQRDLRHKLESFHGRQDPAAVATVWPYLGDPDRALRYAARVALEWQDPAAWREKALSETDTRKSIAAIAAQARVSGRDDIHRAKDAPAPDAQSRARLLAALDRINYKSIPYADKLDLLRAYSLVFIRLQRPDELTVKRYADKFDPLFPAETREENFELAEMIVYLQSPNAATKLVKAMREAPSQPHQPRKPLINPQTQGTPLDALAKQEEQIHYALQLRKLTVGWTTALREEYFNWFITTAPTFRGDNTFASSNAGIANDARTTLNDGERTALQPILDKLPQGRGRGGGPVGGFAGRGGIPNATPGQTAALAAMDQALANPMAAATAARMALIAATFAVPRNDADLKTKNEQLAAADLALANARAAEFAKIQASPDKLNAEQIAALVAQGSGGFPGGRGGRGGPPGQ